MPVFEQPVEYKGLAALAAALAHLRHDDDRYHDGNDDEDRDDQQHHHRAFGAGLLFRRWLRSDLREVHRIRDFPHGGRLVVGNFVILIRFDGITHAVHDRKIALVLNREGTDGAFRDQMDKGKRRGIVALGVRFRYRTVGKRLRCGNIIDQRLELRVAQGADIKVIARVGARMCRNRDEIRPAFGIENKVLFGVLHILDFVEPLFC